MLIKAAHLEQFSEGLSIQLPSVGLGTVDDKNHHFQIISQLFCYIALE